MTTEDPRGAVAALADVAFEQAVAADPFVATMLGAPGHDHRVPDLSTDADASRLAELDALLAAAAAIDTNALSSADRATLAVAVHVCTVERDQRLSRLAELAADPFTGAHVAVAQWLPRTVLQAVEDVDAYIERCARLDRYLLQAADRLRAGVARDRAPAAATARLAAGQVDAVLAIPIREDPLLHPARSAPFEVDDVRRRRLAEVVDGHVRPALARYRRALLDDVLPHARDDEQCGLTWLPDGAELYAAAIRRHTATDLGADRVHELGLDAVGAVQDEFASLGWKAFGTTERAELCKRLRDDEALRFGSGAEVLAEAERLIAGAEQELPRWFGLLPGTRCEVRAVPEHEGRGVSSAYYQQPPLDDSRPGVFWLDVSLARAPGRADLPVSTYHEAVPGHHLQVAVAHRLDLPPLRRVAPFTAYQEGWGLYAERLADEMQLYEDDVARLGMVFLDLVRACRLVVDTGLHHLGWSRAKAIGYLADHSPLSETEAAVEVDRYLALPGQALAYYVGRAELLRLRERASSTMGASFDVRGFHDRVLGTGPVPFSVLDEVLDQWLQEPR